MNTTEIKVLLALIVGCVMSASLASIIFFMQLPSIELTTDNREPISVAFISSSMSVLALIFILIGIKRNAKKVWHYLSN